MSSEERNLLDPAFRLLHLEKRQVNQPLPPQGTATLLDVVSPSKSVPGSDSSRHMSRKGTPYTKEEDAMLIAYIDDFKEKNRKAKRDLTYRIASADTWKKFEQLVRSVSLQYPPYEEAIY